MKLFTLSVTNSRLWWSPIFQRQKIALINDPLLSCSIKFYCILQIYLLILKALILFYLFLKFYLFILRECMNMSGGGAEREETILSRLHSVSTEPNVGFELTNRKIMTWAEIKSGTLNWLSLPGDPKALISKESFRFRATKDKNSQIWDILCDKLR